MEQINNELTTLENTKGAIKAAIEAKGVAVGAVPFAEYAAKIAELVSGGGGFEIVPCRKDAPLPGGTALDFSFQGNPQSMPLLTRTWVVCLEDDAGYTAGDAVECYGIGDNMAPPPYVFLDPDNGVMTRTMIDHAAWWVMHKNTGAKTTITREKWNYHVEVWVKPAPSKMPERVLVRKKVPTADDPVGYDIYSDGYCKATGRLMAAESGTRDLADKVNCRVVLPIRMANTIYTPTVSPLSKERTNFTNTMTWSFGMGCYVVDEQNISINVYGLGTDDRLIGGVWTVEGYADPAEYTKDKWGDDTPAVSWDSYMTGDPSPFKFKAWTNTSGETVYTLLAKPVGQGDDMYPEDQLAVVNAGNVPNVVSNCGALGIMNSNRAINGGGTIMGTPGEFDPTTAYVRNQALDTNGD